MQFSSILSLPLISKHSLRPLSSNTTDLAALFWALRRVVEECSDVSEESTASIFRETGSTFLREVETLVHGAEKGPSAGQLLRYKPEILYVLSLFSKLQNLCLAIDYNKLISRK
jgi:hypothetical protein